MLKDSSQHFLRANKVTPPTLRALAAQQTLSASRWHTCHRSRLFSRVNRHCVETEHRAFLTARIWHTGEEGKVRSVIHSRRPFKQLIAHVHGVPCYLKRLRSWGHRPSRIWKDWRNVTASVNHSLQDDARSRRRCYSLEDLTADDEDYESSSDRVHANVTVLIPLDRWDDAFSLAVFHFHSFQKFQCILQFVQWIKHKLEQKTEWFNVWFFSNGE